MIHVNARAILEREGPEGIEILIQVRNKPHESGRAKTFELPGGRIEPFESIAKALRREVFEETGLTVTAIAGLERRLESSDSQHTVECLAPYAVYQTLRGPVDSFGVYLRCRAEGELAKHGDDSLAPRWVSLPGLRTLLAEQPEAFSWIDRAGIEYYLSKPAT